jgi:hypothetical protein
MLAAAGRVVASLSGVGGFGAQHSLVWNGLSSSGRQLPAGAYWLRLSGATKSELSRVVVIR